LLQPVGTRVKKPPGHPGNTGARGGSSSDFARGGPSQQATETAGLSYLRLPNVRPGLLRGADGREGLGDGRNDRDGGGGDDWRPNVCPWRSPPGEAYFELL